ncbi:MAG: NAD(P)/FAD-dependent oxidoreductase [Brevefilum sp.]|nr:NAD(P)/FAD-dependent oxidoreductase [Brevefilum sp.]
MIYDAIIVGGGASGLTAAAYLAKFGHSILLLEKQPHCGGLISTFTRDGFKFDGGIRALDNAGALFPMLKQLGIELDFVDNPITVGIEDEVIWVESDHSLEDYQGLLNQLYPESVDEITAIMDDIKQIMHDMEIQYGINNPLFLDIKEDRDYFIKEVFPWLFKYALTVRKVAAKNQPVDEYLQSFSHNQSLIDIIAQHFFTKTPAFFALSYFHLYQDYYYPKGGTGAFIQALVDLIQQNGGEVVTDSTVKSIDFEQKTVVTEDDGEFNYRYLLWTADQKTLYEMAKIDSLAEHKTRDAVRERKELIAGMAGNDSILTLFLSAELDKSYFEDIASGHFFYTPSREGQTQAGVPPIGGTWEAVQGWLARYFALTTYEISIPVLRDSSLAPEGKTGLIISVLFDYQLTKYIYDQGWEEPFRTYAADLMIKTLDQTIYPGLAQAVLDRFTSTPVTVQRLTGSTDGAITGWAFTNHPMPAESQLVRIANAVNTPLPDVYQAGQWTYSPSGLPVSLITGKLAADKIKSRLKKFKKCKG